jgi:pimeloyl-ACP methyl ester carboxylesterase
MADYVTPPNNCGHASAVLMPNRYRDHLVAVKRDLPGVVILVHGVNDVGVSYPAMDSGLCAGLNERLDRPDLFPNDFLMPDPKDDVVPDPDAIYYRRLKNDKTYSPVIHFHWGYKASDQELRKGQVNGQNVDKFGNRLDANFAKCGGMFCNATSNIPDMFKGHFNGGFMVWITNKLIADKAHIITRAPERHYMVLAAKRLAALVKQIRAIAADDTVTLVAHSQGCLVSLTAQAFLSEDGQRPVDCLIMNNPPYGVHEPPLDQLTQSGSELQTTKARVNTLVNLVKLITNNPHPSPPLADLCENAKSFGRAGLMWSPAKGQRLPLATANSDDDSDMNGIDNVSDDLGKTVNFDERENRGKVYLYFCPHDMTVGLASVQGIGTLGIPETVNTLDNMGRGTTLPVFSQLPTNFKQRIWTWVKRGQGNQVGAFIGPFAVREKGEEQYPEFTARLSRTSLDVNETRQINAELLNPPLVPDLHAGETADHQANPNYIGKQHLDPIDACDAIVKAGPASGETNDQARKRFQEEELMPNSYHSAIVTNQEHHRWVTAMDLALGQAESLDDPDWRDLLMAIADWRTKFDKNTLPLYPKYGSLLKDVQALVDANCQYYLYGKFPDGLVPKEPPQPIVSERIKDRLNAGAQGMTPLEGR